MKLGRFEDTWQRALAELVVIAVGVFCGLAADRWNESRKEHTAQISYLESLLEDLDTDAEQLAIAAASDATADRAAAELLEVMRVGLEALDDSRDLAFAIVQAGEDYRPQVTRGTVDELRSTGGLRLIVSPAVKRWISTYYGDIESDAQLLDDLGAVRTFGTLAGPVLPLELRLRLEESCCDPRQPRPLDLVDGYDAAGVAGRLRRVEGLTRILEQLRVFHARKRWIHDDRATNRSILADRVREELARLR